MAAATSLNSGYLSIPFLESKEIQEGFKQVEGFFNRETHYKQQFITSSPMTESGYIQNPGKECYTVRNRNLPREFEFAISYHSKVHQIALGCLKQLEQQQHMEPGSLTVLASKEPLSETEDSASLLRLFAYEAASEEGIATQDHQDLGLLTIIPKSNAPALEAFDFTDMDWVNCEKNLKESEAVVLIGETLGLITKLTPCTHRVMKSAQRRFSMVYQLRAEPTARLSVKGRTLTVQEWMDEEKSRRSSVNGSY